MDRLLFSHSAMYPLQQLVKAVRIKTGVRHRLTKQKDIFSLLRYSCTSPDPHIAHCYALLVDELDQKQRDYLHGRGLLLPRTSHLGFTKANTVQSRAAI